MVDLISIDYNRQEGMSIRLIFTNYIRFIDAKKGGCFIIKYLIFLKPTSQLIYLLSTFYEKLFIINQIQVDMPILKNILFV